MEEAISQSTQQLKRRIKDLEEALADKEKVLNTILESTLAGYWDWYIKDGYEYLSPTFKQMFGYQDHELPNSPDTWQKLIFPEDLDRVLNLFEAHVASKGKVPYDNEVRYRHKDGSTVHVFCRGKVIEWGENGEPLRMIGSHVDITPLKESQREIHFKQEKLQLTLEGINAGIWEWDWETNKVWWSEVYYELIGHSPDTIQQNAEVFFRELLHPDDLGPMRRALENHNLAGTPFHMEIRLKHAQKGYRWFEANGKSKRAADGQVRFMAGSIIDIHERKILETQHLQAEFLLEETSRIALLGGWSYDLNTEELRWSREVFQIYDLPADYQPTLRDGLKFYPKEARKKVAFAMKEAISHAKPWDLELPFVSAKGRKLWVRAKGEPVLDQDGKCTQLRGIFQDITEKKEKEIEQQKTKELLISQNDQLSSFAHIVSHNLRKHSGNLEMMTSMYQEAEEEEKPLFFEKIEAVSTSFSDTIDQLAEVVKISVDINKKRKPVFFDKVLKKTYTILEGEITKIEAEISADFKEIGGLAYPPAYMESIFLNLLSNSIRYRHPDRKPIILFRSFKEDGKVKLSCTDNGLGIDLNMHSGKVFGMYKTFHKNEDARGVGLFLIHNQVTALGGGINVESEVGKWTTFTITF